MERCWPKILRVVRRKLNRPLRSLFDSSDFANDVLKSLIARSDRFDFPNFDALVAFLIQSAEKKVIDEYRHQFADRRSLDRIRRLAPYDSEDRGNEPCALDPTPSELAQASEARESILARTDASGRAIIELKAQNYTNREAAARTGVPVRKIQRLLKRLYDSWHAWGDHGP